MYLGLVPRDDDMEDPRAGVVYLYNEDRVSISGLSENNHFRGRTIYTGCFRFTFLKIVLK